MTSRAAANGGFERAVDALLWLGIALGTCARLVRYVDARSLWGDEAQLALNLMKRGAAELLEPLDMAQSAPYGFLVLERAMLEAFGAGELALRALPLMAALLALPVFAHLAWRLLAPRDALLALFLFATSEPLIFYASELKPYSFDVLIALGLLALGLPHLHSAGDDEENAEADPDGLGMLGVAGALAVWFSHPAAFVLAAIGVAWALALYQRGVLGTTATVQLGFVGGAWALSFAAAFLAQGEAALADPYLQEFWANAFAPFPPTTADAWLWYPKTFFGFFSDPLGLAPASFALLAACVGGIRLLRTQPLWLCLLLGAPLFALLASMAGFFPLRTWPGVDIRDRVFPFVGRLWLFAVPIALLLIAGGLGWLRERSEALAVAALVLVCGLSLRQGAINVLDPPRVQEFRPVAERMREELKTGDRVWIQRGSEPVFEYYARQLGLGVSAQNVGALEPGHRDAFEVELAALTAGDRVWLVQLSHPAWTTAEAGAALRAGIETRAAIRREITAHGAAATLFTTVD